MDEHSIHHLDASTGAKDMVESIQLHDEQFSKVSLRLDLDLFCYLVSCLGVKATLDTFKSILVDRYLRAFVLSKPRENFLVRRSLLAGHLASEALRVTRACFFTF